MIFVVSPPRSNARLLFDALARSPDVAPLGDGTSSPLDRIPELVRPRRLGLGDVTASIADAVRACYRVEGKRPLDATPRHSRRIAFLAAIFPDAQFVYVYRDPRTTTRSLREARQWAFTTSILLNDLERLPAGRWAVVSEEAFLRDPDAEVGRLCTFLGIAPPVAGLLGFSVATQQPSNPATLPTSQWASVIDPVAARARELFANAPAAPRNAPEKPSAFRSVATTSFPGILHRLGISLIVTTYQSGRVVLVRAQDATTLNTHFRMFRSPMGVALGHNAIAIGCEREVWDYRNMPDVARKLQPPGLHDACFVPRNVHYTGDIRIHEIGYGADGALWAVNTRFSTLCTLDRDHSFVPRWRPPFVTQLAAEDRCHLNGMTMIDGRVQYVTALAETNEAGAWRQHKVAGGIVMEVPSGRIVLRGLSMPHSPRIHDDRFWFLQSGKGELNRGDLATGELETIAQLPGFTRGLAFAGPFAFVGLSQVRESNVFGGIPLVDRVQDRRCGVWVIDLRSRETVAFLQFEGDVREIFDVQVLPMRYPELLDAADDLVSVSYVVPDEALRDVRHP